MIKQNGIDSHNIHNVELCHAVNCRKHKKLKKSYGGMFCSKHLLIINNIRTHINHLGNSNEIYWRLEELKLRKYVCNRHLYYLWELNEYNVSNEFITYENYIDNMNLINEFMNHYFSVYFDNSQNPSVFSRLSR